MRRKNEPVSNIRQGVCLGDKKIEHQKIHQRAGFYPPQVTAPTIFICFYVLCSLINTLQIIFLGFKVGSQVPHRLR